MFTDKEKFYLLVVGTRTHAFATSRFYKMFEECVDTLLQKQQDKEIVIVQGGCPTGGDYLARQYADTKGYKLETITTKYTGLGKTTSYKKAYMEIKEKHRYIAQYPNRGVFAWWDGESVLLSEIFAEEFNNPIKVFRFWGLERGWKECYKF